MCDNRVGQDITVRVGGRQCDGFGGVFGGADTLSICNGIRIDNIQGDGQDFVAVGGAIDHTQEGIVCAYRHAGRINGNIQGGKVRAVNGAGRGCDGQPGGLPVTHTGLARIRLINLAGALIDSP